MPLSDLSPTSIRLQLGMKSVVPVLVTLLLAALPQVLSRGIVIQMKIDDKTYKGRISTFDQTCALSGSVRSVVELLILITFPRYL